MPTLTCVRWYERVGTDFTASGRWLRAAERFPEAVPLRFGSTEPLMHRFDEEGANGLLTAEQTSGGVLFLKLQNARSQVSLATPGPSAAAAAGSDYGAHTLIAEVSPGEPRLREFALAFASDRTIFISISLRRRPDFGDPGLREAYLTPLGRWLGLPPARPVWAWFGTEYTRELSRGHVPLEAHGHGTVLAGPDWVPSQLRARPDEPGLRRRTAPRIPHGLR